ncbi:LPP20 family lipoprotein [Aquisalimonas asiatica]|uniref:LPP20 family lipoprotein n=1 Tax=Aquisalimonas asiatica TaxID=406100 RepID=UPI00149570DA|nr:LPP20 family lipoprotein [Aquisalimonas asiatica]
MTSSSSNRGVRAVCLAVGGVVLLCAGLAKAGPVALSATGYGDSESAARADALRSLSEQVVAEVDGETEVRTTIDADGERESMDSRIATRSEGYFEGVDYAAPESSDDHYQVEARLPDSGLVATLDQIRRDLDRDFAAMSPRDLEAAVDRADFGLALAGYASRPTAEVEQAVEAFEAARGDAVRYLDFARITFDVEPDDARITLEDTRLDNRQQQLVPTGVYRYRIEADGYQPETDSLRVNSDTDRTETIALVPDVDAVVRLDAPDCCERAARRVLGDYGFRVADDAPVTLRFQLDQTYLTEVSGEAYYRLQGEVESLRDGDVVASNSATLRQVGESAVDDRSAAVIGALTRAIISGERARTLFQDTNHNH